MRLNFDHKSGNLPISWHRSTYVDLGKMLIFVAQKAQQKMCHSNSCQSWLKEASHYADTYGYLIMIKAALGGHSSY